MLKSTLLAGMLAIAATAGAYAQDDSAACTDAGMKQLQSSIDAEQNQANKEAAMKHMMLAQQSMQANNQDQCAVHMGEARKSLGLVGQ